MQASPAVRLLVLVSGTCNKIKFGYLFLSPSLNWIHLTAKTLLMALSSPFSTNYISIAIVIRFSLADRRIPTLQCSLLIQLDICEYGSLPQLTTHDTRTRESIHEESVCTYVRTQTHILQEKRLDLAKDVVCIRQIDLRTYILTQYVCTTKLLRQQNTHKLQYIVDGRLQFEFYWPLIAQSLLTFAHFLGGIVPLIAFSPLLLEQYFGPTWSCNKIPEIKIWLKCDMYLEWK